MRNINKQSISSQTTLSSGQLQLLILFLSHNVVSESELRTINWSENVSRISKYLQQYLLPSQQGFFERIHFIIVHPISIHFHPISVHFILFFLSNLKPYKFSSHPCAALIPDWFSGNASWAQPTGYWVIKCHRSQSFATLGSQQPVSFYVSCLKRLTLQKELHKFYGLNYQFARDELRDPNSKHLHNKGMVKFHLFPATNSPPTPWVGHNFLQRHSEIQMKSTSFRRKKSQLQQLRSMATTLFCSDLIEMLRTPGMGDKISIKVLNLWRDVCARVVWSQ